MLQGEAGNLYGASSGQKDEKEWIPAFGGMTDGRARGEVLVSCYTFLETGIGGHRALGLPWTCQR
jgi:hypothetical protein